MTGLQVFFGSLLLGAFVVALALLMNRRKERFFHIQHAFWRRTAFRLRRRFGAAGNVVYNAQNLRSERYYFTGGQVLQAGQPLVLQTNPATSASSVGYPFDVQCPDANTNLGFIGVVHPESVGFTGPGYISVIVPQPGDILQILCGSTSFDQSVDDPMELKNAVPTASSTKTTGNGNGCFIQAAAFKQTIASSDTLTLANAITAIYKVKCRLLESFASVSATAAGARALKWVQFC